MENNKNNIPKSQIDAENYFNFLEQNLNYWETKEYIILNLNTLLKFYDKIGHNYFKDLVRKIRKNNFKYIKSVSEILGAYGINLNFNSKTSKKEIYSKLNKLPNQIEPNNKNLEFKINLEDIILNIQNGKIIDLIDGDIVVVSKEFYDSIKIKGEDVVEKSKLGLTNKLKFSKIKWIIWLISLIIVALLFVLVFFSGDIGAQLQKFQAWMEKIAGKTMDDEYFRAFEKFLEFLIKILIVYFVYKIFIITVTQFFKHFRHKIIKMENKKLSKTSLTLNERIEQYISIIQETDKKVKAANRIFKIFLRLLLFLFIVIIFLSLFNLSFSSLLTSAGIITLALTIGIQTLLSDYVGGLIFIFEDHYNLGDLVTINGISGRVIEVNLRRICIETYSKERHYILHSQIKHILNFSKDNNKAVVNLSMSYEQDLESAMKIIVTHLNKIWAQNENIIEAPTVDYIMDFEDSGISFRIQAECEKETRWSVERWLRREVYKIMNKYEIEIPYKKIVIINPENNTQSIENKKNE